MRCRYGPIARTPTEAVQYKTGKGGLTLGAERQ